MEITSDISLLSKKGKDVEVLSCCSTMEWSPATFILTIVVCSILYEYFDYAHVPDVRTDVQWSLAELVTAVYESSSMILKYL